MVDTKNVAAALAAMHDASLASLRDTVESAPEAVPGLVAWLSHALRWELDRRAGREYPLQGPRAAIPDDELHLGLGALCMLAGAFRLGAAFGGAEVADFFEVAVATLRAEAGIAQTLQ